jgi:hypothetical protein
VGCYSAVTYFAKKSLNKTDRFAGALSGVETKCWLSIFLGVPSDRFPKATKHVNADFYSQ